MKRARRNPKFDSRADFYLNKLDVLVGGKVMAPVRSGAHFGLEFFGLDIKLRSGKTVTLWFQSDDEGNGPGAFTIDSGA